MEPLTCKVDGCEKPKHSRGLCSMHYRRWQLTGDPGPAGTLRVPGEITPCNVPNCDKPKRSSGAEWCEMHYARMRRKGSLEGRPVYTNEICSVGGCERPNKDTGMCEMHATRVRRHGDPHVVKDVASRNLARGERNASWTGDEATYDAAHHRVKTARGSARKQRCADCGEQAAHWSYNHLDPDDRADDRGYRYSTRIEFYEPRCVPCHKSFDLARLKEPEPESAECGIHATRDACPACQVCKTCGPCECELVAGWLQRTSA